MSPPARPVEVFFTYAHADNADGWIATFVRRLCEVQRDLDPSAPWHIFFDEQAIRTGEEWEKRIRQSVRGAGVMVALMSPAYFRSEWCRREWHEFREQERRRGGRWILPLLIEDHGNFTDDPERRQDLSTVQHLDLRRWRSCGLEEEDTQRILRQLERQIHTRLTQLAGIPAIDRLSRLPELPRHFVARPDKMHELSQALLSGGNGEKLLIGAVHGLPAVGKSTLALAVARDRQVQEHFEDGVLWVTLGQKPEVLSLLATWIRLLGDSTHVPFSIADSSSHLQAMLSNKVVLLVIDDAWSPDDVAPFVVGGSRCRVLITSRLASIAHAVGGATLIDLDVMSPAQSLQLVARYLDRDLGEQEKAQWADLARVVGHLPLALELLAAQVREGVPLAQLHGDLNRETLRLEHLDRPGADEARGEGTRKKLSLAASVRLSLSRLKSKELQRFAWLGLLPDDVTITRQLAATLWDTDSAVASKALNDLAGRAILLRGTSWRGEATYRLHDVLHDEAWALLERPTDAEDDELPGLGLSSEEAHRVLLDRYRRKTTEGRWHTLPNDGYIHAHLGRHLAAAGRGEQFHEVLAEETSEGHNGWFEACEMAGQPGAFVDMVERASVSARREVLESGGSRGLEKQVRYVLMKATLRTLVSNVPPCLLEELISRGVWHRDQALAYVRQITRPAPRFNALRKITLKADPTERTPLLREMLEAAREGGDTGDRALALCWMIETFPELDRVALLAEARELAWRSQDKKHRRRAFLKLADMVSEHERRPLVEEAFRVAKELWVENESFLAFHELSGYLPPGLLEEVLGMARACDDPLQRCAALCQLARPLAGQIRESLAAEALAAFRDAEPWLYRGLTFSDLLGVLPQQRMIELVPDIRAEDNDLSRLSMWEELIPRLPDAHRLAAFEEAWEQARATDDKDRGGHLAGLARNAPEGLRPAALREALDAVRAVPEAVSRCRALAKLARFAPPSDKKALFDEAHTAVGQITDNSTTFFYSLLDLLPDLVEPGRSGAIRQLLAAIHTERNANERWGRLDAVAPHLADNFLGSALRMAWQIGDDDSVFATVAAIAPLVAERDRATAFAEVLTRTLVLDEGKKRCRALADLAPSLPPALLAEALAVTRRDPNPETRSRLLSALAPHLSPEVRGDARREALESAREAQDVDLTLEAFAQYAPHLSEDERRRELAEVFDAARSAGNEQNYFHVLLTLGPLLTEPERSTILAEVLRLIRSTGEGETLWRQAPMYSGDGGKTEALCYLLPSLPPGLLIEALDIARQTGDPARRCEALAAFLPHLPDGERQFVHAEALQACLTIGDEVSRYWSLCKLPPPLPADLIDLAVRFARQFDNKNDRSILLAGWLPHLTGVRHHSALTESLLCRLEHNSQAASPIPMKDLGPFCAAMSFDDLLPLWNDAIGLVAGLPRRSILQLLEILISAMAKSLGSNVASGIFQALTDVVRWWP